jgi:hypothetical protein
MGGGDISQVGYDDIVSYEKYTHMEIQSMGKVLEMLFP